MAFYMDAKRIPPERLVDRPPQDYDRILQTYDIDGARSKVKSFQPESHGYSLKTNDIKGAQPKKKIRNIWGQYSYNPTDKNLTKSQDFVAQQQQFNQAPIAGVQTGHRMEDGGHLQRNSSQIQIDPQQIAQNQSLPPEKLFKERRHMEPQSQIKSQDIMKPAQVLQPYLDYDKVVQPYQKPDRDRQLYDQYQQQQADRQSQPKHADLPDKMDQYKQTQGQLRQFDQNKLRELGSQVAQPQMDPQQYQQYGQQQQGLPQMSSQAQLAQKNLLPPPAYPSNDQPQEQQYQQQPQIQQQQYDQQNNNSIVNQSNLQIQDNQYKPPTGRLSRQQQGSQSVANVNQNPQTWDKHKYNLIGGFVEDKREYHRDQTSSLEKKYYNEYNLDRANEMRKTQNQGTQPVTSHAPQVRLNPNQLDHADRSTLETIEKQLNSQKDNYKFGRSQLADEFQLKPNIASHQKQFIGNIIQERQQTKFPQRYGPQAQRNFSNNILDD